MKRVSKRIFGIALGIAALYFLACATSGVNKGDINLFSTEDELKLGEQFSQEIAREMPLLEDAEVVGYFARVGERIAANSDWRDLPYHFHVVNTEEINAFAIPGGHVYLNRGLILAAENLCEVAGVTGHEISHIVARHGTEALTRQYGVGIVASLVLGRNPALWEQILASLFTNVGLLHYGRKAESEADYLGVKYVYKTGYDPQGMVTFFEKLLALQKKNPTLLDKLFSTHPPTAERIAAVKAEIVKLPPKANLIKDDPEFHRVQAKLKSIPAPAAKK